MRLTWEVGAGSTEKHEWETGTYFYWLVRFFFNIWSFIFFRKNPPTMPFLKNFFFFFLLVHIYSIFILDSADVALTVSLGKYLQAIGRRPVIMAMDFIFPLPLLENTQFLQNLYVCPSVRQSEFVHLWNLVYLGWTRDINLYICPFCCQGRTQKVPRSACWHLTFHIKTSLDKASSGGPCWAIQEEQSCVSSRDPTIKMSELFSIPIPKLLSKAQWEDNFSVSSHPHWNHKTSWSCHPEGEKQKFSKTEISVRNKYHILNMLRSLWQDSVWRECRRSLFSVSEHHAWDPSCTGKRWEEDSVLRSLFHFTTFGFFSFS